MAGWRGPRSYMQSPYHYDAFFGLRTHLSRMRWDRGNLIRTQDKDSMELGDREVKISRVLRNNQTEMQPDKKLQTSAAGMQILDILI